MNEPMDVQVAAQVRNSLIMLGGALVGGSLSKYGIDSSAVMPSAVGLIMTLGGAAWSWWAHSNAQVISAATKVPGVVAVVATPAIIDSPPSDKLPFPTNLDTSGKSDAPVVTVSEVMELLRRAGRDK